MKTYYYSLPRNDSRLQKIFCSGAVLQEYVSNLSKKFKVNEYTIVNEINKIRKEIGISISPLEDEDILTVQAETHEKADTMVRDFYSRLEKSISKER